MSSGLGVMLLLTLTLWRLQPPAAKATYAFVELDRDELSTILT